jgi:D-alanyl-D-alanine carboxypeptidase
MDHKKPLFRMNYSKNIFSLFLIFLSMYWGYTVQAAPQSTDLPSDIYADAWVVMDSQTGEVLSENNMKDRHFPASITKMITAIIAIEQKDLDEIVTVSKTAAETIGSSLYLEEGDKIHLRDLLYGIMLHSGNDGAVAIAEHMAGSEAEFAKQMTAFVRSIGAANTHFTNASGLPDDEHYTTAEDMAIITRYAMKNSIFKEMVKHQTYNWDEELARENLLIHEKEDAKGLGIPWTGQPQIVNHNRLLSEYDGAIGIKNGFTHEARYTLVGAAKRDDTELFAVVLRSDNVDTAYQDITKLLDYGFAFVNHQDNEKNQIDDGSTSQLAEPLNKQIEKFEQVEKDVEVGTESKGNDPAIAEVNSSLLKSIPVIVYVVITSMILGWIVFLLILKKRYNGRGLQ